MSGRPHDSEIDPELARLADGTLPAERAEHVRERAGSDPVAGRALEEQQRMLALLRAAEMPAPERLHRYAERATARSRRTPRRRGAFALGGLAAAGAAAAAAVVIAVVPSGAGTPTAIDAAAVATRPAVLPAPPEEAGRTLARAVQGIAYPYWGRRFGWRGVGSRDDRVGAHAVTTVFYADARKRRLGYAIVAGPPLPVPQGTVVVQHGVPFSVTRRDGTSIVTWRRRGHTCILAARDVSPATLLRLGASQTT